MKTPLIIHIGFPKTATTTLQNHLFSKHGQIRYLGKPYADKKFETALHHLMMTDSINYDPQAFPLKGYIIDQLEEASQSDEARAVVLSEEIFLSYSKVRDRGQVAQRLKGQLAPDKIIITLRNQYSLLKSAYLGRGRLMMNVPPRFEGLSVTFEQWLKLSLDSMQSNYLEVADYAKTVDFYCRLFGKENVCVLLMEELSKNKETFLQQLSFHMGIDAAQSQSCLSEAHDNRAITQAALEDEQLRTRYYPFSGFLPVSGAIKMAGYFKKKRYKERAARVEFSPDWLDTLKQRYSKGNQRLVEEYGLPLEKYGYPLC